MPGILFGYNSHSGIQEDPFACALDKLCHSARYTYAVHRNDSFLVAPIACSTLGHSHSQGNKDVDVWVYGCVYPLRSEPLSPQPSGVEKESAGWVRACYQKYGLDFVHHLNGEFNIVLHDKFEKRLIAANDRFGIRPWYVLEKDTEFWLSPETKGLIPFLNAGPKLDRDMAISFLAFNKMRLGDRTLLEDITVLPAGSLWIIDLQSGKVEKDIYWEFSYNDSMPDRPPSQDMIHDLVECYRDAMAIRARTRPDRRVGISLSGGLDSRTMVAALSPEHRQTVSAHTYGLTESDEVQLAAQVTRMLGMRQYIYHLDAGDYVSDPESCLAYCDELDIFVQSGQQKWLNEGSQKADVMMTGIDLDVTLGGIYLVPDVMEARDDTDVAMQLKKKNAVFKEDELALLLSGGACARSIQAPYDLAMKLVTDLPQENPAAKYDAFINKYSMRRIIMLRYAMIRYFMETSSPMYDYDFMDLIRQIPLSQRYRYRSFKPFLHELSPEMEALTYQRTMLPASAPFEFWTKASAIEGQREQLYLDIWRETGGALHIPYRRYYTNFDEWLRLDPAWKAFADELLGSGKSLLYGMDICSQAYIARLLEEHRTGVRSNRQKLICLMSLELFLRYYFG